MIKKLISASVILVAAVTIGALVDVSPASAAGDEVVFSADTATGLSDLVVKSGGQVTSIAVGASDVTLTLGADSDITFESASGAIMSVDCAGGSTFTAGSPSQMRVDYVDADTCTTVVLTIGSGTLTEPNVAANPLTAGTASTHTVTFRTVNALTSGQKIKLAFGGGYTIADNTTASNVTTLTDDGTSIASGISLASVAANKTITITLASSVAARSVINIVLNSALVTNPATASADTAVSGIDIYTTTSGGTTIDSLPNQTAFNRVIDLEPGWNIFAPSQALENSAYATVLTPISGSYSDIYTLIWNSTTETMTWQTPTTIDPLYGYAIYITGSSAVKLPLDFAKETPSNSTFTRNLTHKGWQLIGYVGSDANAYLMAQTYQLDGLTVAGQEQFSSIVDLTGTTAGVTAPSNHSLGSSSTTELAADNPTMRFHQDFGYAIFTTADSLALGGERERNDD